MTNSPWNDLCSLPWGLNPPVIMEPWYMEREGPMDNWLRWGWLFFLLLLLFLPYCFYLDPICGRHTASVKFSQHEWLEKWSYAWVLQLFQLDWCRSFKHFPFLSYLLADKHCFRCFNLVSSKHTPGQDGESLGSDRLLRGPTSSLRGDGLKV